MVQECHENEGLDREEGKEENKKDKKEDNVLDIALETKLITKEQHIVLEKFLKGTKLLPKERRDLLFLHMKLNIPGIVKSLEIPGGIDKHTYMEAYTHYFSRNKEPYEILYHSDALGVSVGTLQDSDFGSYILSNFNVNTKNFIIGISRAGYIDFLKKEIYDTVKNDGFIFNICCRYGHMDILTWLWKISNGRINIHVNKCQPFRWACKYGQLEVAKWLWKISEESLDINGLVKMAIENFHYNILKYLSSIKDISSILIDKFDTAAKHRQFDEMRTILKGSSEVLDVDEVFYKYLSGGYYCTHGWKDVCGWFFNHQFGLHNIVSEKIVEKLFLYLCDEGENYKARYLCNKAGKLFSKYALAEVFQKGNLDMAMWLWNRNEKAKKEEKEGKEEKSKHTLQYVDVNLFFITVFPMFHDKKFKAVIEWLWSVGRKNITMEALDDLIRVATYNRDYKQISFLEACKLEKKELTKIGKIYEKNL